MAIRIARIDDRQRDRGALAHVGRLDAIDTHVDQDRVPVVVDPKRRHVRRAVRANRGQVTEGVALEQVDHVRRDLCRRHCPKHTYSRHEGRRAPPACSS
jgi:hypothetical protein